MSTYPDFNDVLWLAGSFTNRCLPVSLLVVRRFPELVNAIVVIGAITLPNGKKVGDVAEIIRFLSEPTGDFPDFHAWVRTGLGESLDYTAAMTWNEIFAPILGSNLLTGATAKNIGVVYEHALIIQSEVMRFDTEIIRAHREDRNH